ncbi:MAG: methyltransferase [Candidatus Melainabacteria bacterium HGW-Melainabacteria-1]|nr:MAG: methyltransferase [Candidatus Melainabacteria bacterium HGW-Melainabacteria-1]
MITQDIFNTVVNHLQQQGYIMLRDVTYCEDALITQHKSVDHFMEPRFAAAYARGKATGSWGNNDLRWRAHVICRAAEQAFRLDGDFVECGVNRGGLSLTVITYLNFADTAKRFYLLDTFSGLAPELVSDQEKASGLLDFNQTYSDCYTDVCKTFAAFSNVSIIKGKVPDTLPQVDSKRIAYLSIDMNCTLPEIAAIEYFWEKLVPGAMVVLDDYGWLQHQEQRQAFDSFAAAHGSSILHLPTGQGVMIRQ